MNKKFENNYLNIYFLMQSPSFFFLVKYKFNSTCIIFIIINQGSNVNINLFLKFVRRRRRKKQNIFNNK